MGKLLGAYDSDELDRPDLNKCPDCGCFFATDACTLCGKLCPEEMRAGNRAKVKQKKRKNTSGRVQFIPWYHTWPAMIIFSFIMPIVGVILFFTSPYSKKVKIIVGSAVVAWVVLAPILLTLIVSLASGWMEGSLVNDKLSRAEYIETCTEMSADEFYRHSVDEGIYVTMELTVAERLPGSWFYEEESVFFYRCESADGKTSVILRDCMLENRQVLKAGDMVRVWGESAGVTEYYPSYDRTEALPCLNTAYCDLIG